MPGGAPLVPAAVTGTPDTARGRGGGWRKLLAVAAGMVLLALAGCAAARAGDDFPAARAGDEFPAARAGDDFPAARAGDDFPAARAGDDFPAARADEGCAPAITAAERENNDLPAHILSAIGVVESGRRDRLTGRIGAWPWSVNAAGDSHMFDTRGEAIAFVREAQARGIRSIDVGCMQINLLYHPDAFASLEEAFTPAANVHYATAFLLNLRERTGDWTSATGNYHSATPGLSEDYARRVRAVLDAEASGGMPPALQPVPLAWQPAPLVMTGAAARRVRVIVPGTAPGGVNVLRVALGLPHVYHP